MERYIKLNDYFIELFIQNVNRAKLIRRINISLNNVIDEIYHVERGYFNIDKNLKSLGANIDKVE